MLCGVLGIQTLSSKVSRSVYFLRDIFGTYSVLVMLIHNYVCICALISCRSSVARDRLLWPVSQDIIGDIHIPATSSLYHSFIRFHSFWRVVLRLFKRSLLIGAPSPVTDKEKGTAAQKGDPSLHN